MGGMRILEIGSVIDGKYKILSKLGQGGMSTVYLALNERANKTWAVKEIRQDSAGDFEALKQGMLAEINILKQLRHKYLPDIVDVIEDKGRLLIVMDYIQGKTLDAVLKESMEKRGEPISPEDVVPWSVQLCDALHYLHTRPKPVIYRDLKPSNVMLKPDGDICIIDFGAARVYESGRQQDTACLGTPGFAAPEQYGGKGQSGPWTDIYNLGAMMHYLMTAHNPAESPFRFPKLTQCRPSLLEKMPGKYRERLIGLEVIIDRCLQYEFKERYQSCEALKYDLEHSEELGRPYRRLLKVKMAAFCGCALLSMAFCSFSIWGFSQEKRTKDIGYEDYMNQAAVKESEEKLESFREAIALKPAHAQAYIKMLEEMLKDNIFTKDEDKFLTKTLYSRDYGRKRTNLQYLQDNPEGIAEFSYKLGMAYYYWSGSGIDKAQAAVWFGRLAEVDMDELDFGVQDDFKYAWQARAKILGKMSTYYKNKIGETDAAGDKRISYKAYWNDLTSLLEADTAKQDNAVTELKLYYEIAYEIYIRIVEFKDEAGISRRDMERVLGLIEEKVSAIDETSAPVCQMKEEFEACIHMAQRSVEAAFSEET